MKLFRIQVFDKEVTKFFQNLIKESLRVREEQKIVRPDVIHLLMEARKGRSKREQTDVIDTGFAVVQEAELGNTQTKTKSEITDDDITAQALIFFLAGFDTASTLVSYTAYELALNINIQKKLQAEVDTISKDCDGKITYEAILGIDKSVIFKKPLENGHLVAALDKLSIKPFTIEPEKPGEKALFLQTGMVCWIPIFAIHRDPKYFPGAEKFNPERFNDENKNDIKPFTYMPFSFGPRNCIASRFTLLESKLIILKILEKVTIVPIEKTQIPIKLSKKTYHVVPDEGFWLGLQLRRNFSS